MKSNLLIFNGKLIGPEVIQENSYLYVKDGIICDIGIGKPAHVDAEILSIDAKGLYISPGFIDMHVHGGGGHDFMDGTVEAFLGVAETHLRYGTTALCPTTLTSTMEALFRTLDAYKAAKEINAQGAQFIGVHLEGPYFALSQKGAQDPKYIRHPDPAEYERILAYSDDIVRWSAAPELPGAIAFGRYVKSKNKLLALAHTDAIYEEVQAAFDNGYTLATHFYSAMSGITRRNAYRYAGAIEAGYLIDGMDVEIIADGIHVPSPLLRLVFKIKGTDRIALITDAMRAAGMPEGESILGGKQEGTRVIVEDGVAKLMDRSAFAGSVATADRLVRTMMREGNVALLDSVQMMTSTPARIMGLDKKGHLAAGMDADIVLFDEDIRVMATIVAGELKYKKED
ncbi:N-acetylglucosamine-6-phosphate deacetylase [Sphingobacterium sp. DN00404]|uniref:N-acetylglucosamine-6-phosphate deacetylase n=1 Tax=Sphingobacterium micropteri TaxID=2763501 RepID=A0ABR7YLC2_9SPHI|nr:N-acetylglucosamine-6-phosphate deacetylase [Sphingobacterium micropteri]MBD1432113.1 N-acetylglucosamine-6-phosphate deacetylase [Sphingobacterium micropteri]